MAGDSMTIVLMICAACCFIMCVVAAILYFTNTACSWFEDVSWVGVGCEEPSQDDSSPAQAPAPAPDPRSSVWSTGEKIQGAPLEIGTTSAPIIFTQRPTLPTTVVYTFSLDLWFESTGSSWRTIFSSGIPPAPTVRYPALFLTGSAADNGGANKIMFYHDTGNGTWPGTTALTPGRWYNLVCTMASDNTLTAYINGVNAGSYTYTSARAWSPDPFYWKPENAGDPSTQKSIKVANVYFWPSVLTSAQISNLAVPYIPTPGIATTSYYMPEPYTMGTEHQAI